MHCKTRSLKSMNLKQRKEAFIALGSFFNELVLSYEENTKYIADENPYLDAFRMQISRAHEINGWFTKENVLNSFKNWSTILTNKDMNKWLTAYRITDSVEPKKIGIIMAGNIPLVGFHDLLSTLITGNSALIKLSSNDQQFIPLIAGYLSKQNAWFKTAIEFTVENLQGFDAVIATGSNNSARYFEHYFGKYPSIIRKNRNGVAVLTGKESKEELELLGDDIFMYFGLGCRSVSKIFVPRGYNFDNLFDALYKFKDIIKYKKYENNYDYNKAVYLMSLFEILENGFLMLKKDSSYGSPIATLFYEYYDSREMLANKLEADNDSIQCIVSNENVVDFIKFGQSQRPKLWNYADDIDTIEFLLNI